MQRRQFIGTIASGILGGSFVRAQDLVATPAEDRLTRTPLALMAPRPNGFEAVWAVSRLCKGRIEWEAESGGKGVIATDDFGFVPQGTDLLRVRVSGLKPGVSYRVRSVTVDALGKQEETSEWKPFRTLNPRAESTKFVVWNDTHVNNPTIQKLHEVTPSADFLLWNGDTCNDWKSPDLLVPTLLHPGERDITHGRPLFFTCGNHDVRGPYAFEMARIMATPNGRPFHAFRSGPVAAVCLHTGEDKPDGHPSFNGRVAFEPLRAEQARWLVETLRSPEMRDAPYRLVFCHIPLRWIDERAQDYSATGFDRFSLSSRQAWHDVLVQWKAQLIISGHTHRDAWLPGNERFPYGQLVGGGPQPRSATWMEAIATPDNLNIKMRDLSGAIRHEIALQPHARA